MYEDIAKELKELSVKDILWFLFAILALISIYANRLQKQYLVTHNKCFQIKAHCLNIFILLASILIYFYFAHFDYQLYENDIKKNKQLDLIRLSGSVLLIIGIILILYYEINAVDPIGGAPVI